MWRDKMKTYCPVCKGVHDNTGTGCPSIVNPPVVTTRVVSINVKPHTCENCVWWNDKQTTLHGTCNKEIWFRKTWCDPEGTGIVTGCPVYATGRNFGCNQWESK
jgi:hypothetical protein